MGSTLDVPAMKPMSLPVKFGKVAFGSDTISISIKLARSVLPTHDGEDSVSVADKTLRQRRLQVVLTNQTEQGDLFEGHDSESDVVKVACVVETANLSVGEKFGLTMNARQNDLSQQEKDDITHLAQREGRLIINDVSAIVDPPPMPKTTKKETPIPTPATSAMVRFVQANRQSDRINMSDVANRKGEAICNNKQLAALATGGYREMRDVALLLSENGGDEDYVETALSSVTGVSKKLARDLIDATKFAVSRREKPNGRLLCVCGELWDTFTGGNESPIGVEASRELLTCPHCDDSTASFRGVEDKSIDDFGEWPEDKCERIDLGRVRNCTAGILLVKDEFGAWRHGIVIDVAGDDPGGWLPTFSPARNDRAMAISKAKIDLLQALRDYDGENQDVEDTLKLIAADKTPIA